MFRRWSYAVALAVLCACGAAAGSAKVTGGGPTGWDVTAPTVPKGVGPPIVEGGLVLNSYRGSDHVLVTLLFDSSERDRIVATYDAWSAGRAGVKSGRGFEIQGRVVWSDVWTTAHSEARMTECLDESSGEFDNLCVALTTWVGSVP